MQPTQWRGDTRKLICYIRSQSVSQKVCRQKITGPPQADFTFFRKKDNKYMLQHAMQQNWGFHFLSSSTKIWFDRTIKYEQHNRVDTCKTHI